MSFTTCTYPKKKKRWCLFCLLDRGNYFEYLAHNYVAALHPPSVFVGLFIRLFLVNFSHTGLHFPATSYLTASSSVSCKLLLRCVLSNYIAPSCVEFTIMTNYLN